MYKILHISSGRTLRAGFDSEDVAQDWMDARDHLNQELYVIEEMDIDEEEEYLTQDHDEDADDGEEYVDESEDELGYDQDDDSDYDPDSNMLSEIDPDEDF